jgi:hypothetical protein
MMLRASKLRAIEEKKLRKQMEIKTEMTMARAAGEQLHQSTRKNWMNCVCLSVIFTCFLAV